MNQYEQQFDEIKKKLISLQEDNKGNTPRTLGLIEKAFDLIQEVETEYAMQEQGYQDYVHNLGEETYSPDCPACLRHQPHSDSAHFLILRDVRQASTPEYFQDEGSM